MIAKNTWKAILKRFFRKVNAPYLLTIVDAESMNESVSFNLTKKSVYFFLASIFVGIFMLFSVLIFFTPLKYYIPGNQNNTSRKDLLKLQNLSDSLITINKMREAYIFNLLKVANGEVMTNKDSITLNEKEIKNAELINDGKIDRASRYDYLKNQKKDSTDVNKKDSIDKIKNK